MHRMIETLPAAEACRAGHAARLMQDLRGAQFGGGLYVECQCCRGNTCSQREIALSNWSRINGRPVPKAHVAALRRFMPFISEKIGALLILSIRDGELALSDRKRENMDTVPLADVSTKGAEIDRGANAKYLLDVLGVLDSDLVALHPPTAAGPMVLLPHNGDIGRVGHLVMPYSV